MLLLPRSHEYWLAVVNNINGILIDWCSSTHNSFSLTAPSVYTTPTEYLLKCVSACPWTTHLSYTQISFSQKPSCAIKLNLPPPTSCLHVQQDSERDKTKIQIYYTRCVYLQAISDATRRALMCCPRQRHQSLFIPQAVFLSLLIRHPLVILTPRTKL